MSSALLSDRIEFRNVSTIPPLAGYEKDSERVVLLMALKLDPTRARRGLAMSPLPVLNDPPEAFGV